ncbi:MAG: saccharopine dehydrogenase [Desulfobacteraceae bacterium]|nr:saccharopine dehydrogenase [Desulfobacteraceae bacterium]
MNVLVLGGCGIQGRTAVCDLSGCRNISSVICADSNPTAFAAIEPFVEMSKIDLVELDVLDESSLDALFKKADIAIDLLPRKYAEKIGHAAVRNGVSIVNSNYSSSISHLDQAARSAGVAIMPECGLDPGIDLILYGHAARLFDELHLINSYCGGFPEKKACDNPLNYKISWIWDGVLNSTKRSGRLIKNNRIVDVSAQEQHLEKNIHHIDFPDLGRLEAIPNGDAVLFTDLLGVTSTIGETGRYTLRWPGWSAFWRPLKALDFLSDDPVPGLPGDISPHQFLTTFLEPRLQYRNDEKDLVVMLNIFEGLKDGKKMRLTSRLVIERDLDTGIMAMSKGVGYPASIVAQMMAGGEIPEKGVLSPLQHVPYPSFASKLNDRGIVLEELFETLTD